MLSTIIFYTANNFVGFLTVSSEIAANTHSTVLEVIEWLYTSSGTIGFTMSGKKSTWALLPWFMVTGWHLVDIYNSCAGHIVFLCLISMNYEDVIGFRLSENKRTVFMLKYSPS